jgi:hypothetical protein
LRAGASRRRHEAFRDHVSDLALGNAGPRREFVDIQCNVLLSI